MSKFVFPKFPVSRWDTATATYVACGSITAITVKNPDYGSTVTRATMTTDDNGVTINSRLPVAMFNPNGEEDEILARMCYVPTSRLQIIAYNSNINITIQLDTSVVLNNDKVYVLFKSKFSKNTKNTLTLTVGDTEGIVVPVRTMKLDHRINNVNAYDPTIPIVGVRSTDSWTSVVYENLYTVKYDDDSTFVATQVRFTGSYSINYDYVYIYLHTDLVANEVQYVRLIDIYNAYHTQTGKYWGFVPRLIIRTITNPVVVGTSSYVIPDTPAVDRLYDYSVGIITQVKNFLLSEDGLTISGNFNGKCNVAMTFNNAAPINFTTNTDGSFTYTGTVNMNVGGQLKLTPSNLIGEHKASTVTITDKIAPVAIANATVTSLGVYGTAEIGAIIKLYDESDVLITTYTVPVGGLVEILFTTPIPSDVQYKLFRYSIADKAGNILGQQLLEFTGSVNEITGPIYSENYDYTGVQLIDINSVAG